MLSSTSRRSQTAKTFSVLVNKKHQHDIDKDQKTTWTCVSMFNLSSFLREWHALLSMKHMQSFPLAGYLLNGSQVVSAAQLASLSESLVAKLRALEIGLRHKAPADRLNVLENSVAKELQNLLEIKVNVALLKFTNIGKEIKHIVKNKDGFYPNSVVGLAENVMASWTGIIKAQEKSSIMRTKKGGKIMEIPEDVALLESSVIAKDLWASLRSMYNRSQLFAIHYTLEQFKTLKDIGVVLVQGKVCSIYPLFNHSTVNRIFCFL
ncbi:hypothetical protein EON65_25775 [archaeon]|nr:MAG: hypothetical protein EON65_25775 [archaeon]